MREFGPRARALRERLEARLAAHGPDRRGRDPRRAAGGGRRPRSRSPTRSRASACARARTGARYVERVSLVEQILQRDPAGVYGRMDFASRDRYRQARRGDRRAHAARRRSRWRSPPPSSARAAHEQRPEDPSAPRRLPPDRQGAACAGSARRLSRRGRLQRVRRAVFRHATLSLPGRAHARLRRRRRRRSAGRARAGRLADASRSLVGLLALLPASDLATGARAAAGRGAGAAAPPAAARPAGRGPGERRGDGGGPHACSTASRGCASSSSTSRCRRSATSTRASASRSSGTSATPPPRHARRTHAVLEAAVRQIEELDRRHGEAPASTCSTGCGASTRAKAAGWAGSASAARSRSS